MTYVWVTSYIAVVSALCLLVWLARRGRAVTADRGPRQPKSYWLLALAWGYSIIPALIQTWATPRPAVFSLTAVVETNRWSGLVGTTLSVLITLFCLVLIISGTRARTSDPARLIAFALPWAVLTVVPGLLNEAALGRQIYLYPLIGLAFWFAHPPVEALWRLFGYLTVATATLAMALGILRPSVGLLSYVAESSATDKAIVGNGALLAGMYSYPNELGLVLALGVPAVCLFTSARIRYASLAYIGFAIVWSGSRTAIVAAAAGLLISTLPKRTTLARTAAAVGAFLIFYSPLTTSDPLAFSKRGQIWTASLEHWRAMKWFGGGPDFYAKELAASSDIGAYAAHGHNVFVNSLTVGGIVGLVGVTIFLLVAYRAASVFTTATAMAYVIALLFSSWLEVLFDFRNLGPYGYAVWLPLALVFFGERQSGEARVRNSLARDAGVGLLAGAARPAGSSAALKEPLH